MGRRWRGALLAGVLVVLGLGTGGSAAPRTFELVEADLASVHAALAGRTVLPDGSRLTCVKLVQLYQRRTLAYNEAPQEAGLALRAVLMLNPHAVEQAAALDRLYQRDRGVGKRFLHCMPVLLKDNYDTFDHPSTSGSYAMLGHQAGRDAHAVAGLRRAGAVILGKTNMDAFAVTAGGSTDRGVRVANAYNTTESSSGSSAGTGAALAASFAVGGTGSDTAQSIRSPASVEALVGIRPSIGVVSRHGIFPLIGLRDTGGPMTRTVRDAALMLTAMAGVDRRDPATLALPSSRRPTSYEIFLDRARHGLRGRTIGRVRSWGSGPVQPTDGDAEQEALVDATVAKLRALGATVYDVTLPELELPPEPATSHYDMNAYFQRFEEEGGHSPRRCLSSSFHGSAHGRAGCTGLEGILENTVRVGSRQTDLIATMALEDPDQGPTRADVQRIVGARDYVTKMMDSWGTDDGATVRLDALVFATGPSSPSTGISVLTQMGSIVVPIGFDHYLDRQGLGTPVLREAVPRGMEILVRRFDEGTAIGIAYDFERATRHRRPPGLVPSPLMADRTLEQFNDCQQLLLMHATSFAPEDARVDDYIDAPGCL